MRAGTRRQSVALFDPDWERGGQPTLFATLHVCTKDPLNAESIDLGVTNKFWTLLELENMEPMNNEDRVTFPWLKLFQRLPVLLRGKKQKF